MSRLELEAKTDAKRLGLDEGVIEEESELFFSGGKDDGQKFWETTLAIDQKERVVDEKSKLLFNRGKCVLFCFIT